MVDVSDAEKLIQSENDFSLWDEKLLNPINITYTFINSDPEYYRDPLFLYDGISGIDDQFNLSTVTELSPLQKLAVIDLTSDTSNPWRVSFSDVSNIEFRQISQTGDGISQSGDITFSQASLVKISGDEQGYEFSGNLVTDSSEEEYLDKSAIIINQNDPSISNLGAGELGLHTLLHELGHSFGLEDIVKTNILNTGYDNQKYSMMSYNAFDGLHATSLQLFDIAALQIKYGRDYTTRNESLDADSSTVGTIYSHENVLYNNSQGGNGAVVYSIWDGGGIDTIDASEFVLRVQIDLRQGHFSSIGLYASSELTSQFEVLFDNYPYSEQNGKETLAFSNTYGVEIPDNPDHGNISIACTPSGEVGQIEGYC